MKIVNNIAAKGGRIELIKPLINYLNHFSINNESVMLAPAAGFYSSTDNGKDEVRIAFVLNSEKIKRAINIINIGLKEYIG